MSVVVVLCVSACGSGMSPGTHPTGTTTALHALDQDATYLGLSVQLQLDAPSVESDRTVVNAHFLIENHTTRAISYRGCPFGDVRFGLLPASHPDGRLLGTAQTSCSGGVASVNPGASDRFFAAAFTTRSRTIRLPAGDYVAVMRFTDGTEVRKSMTLAA